MTPIIGFPTASARAWHDDGMSTTLTHADPTLDSTFRDVAQRPPIGPSLTGRPRPRTSASAPENALETDLDAERPRRLALSFEVIPPRSQAQAATLPARSPNSTPSHPTISR